MATTWNSGDKSASITLSGGSLTATASGATQAGVRATASVSGKVCIEAQIAVSASNWYFGFANVASSLAAVAGADLNGVSTRPVSNVAAYFNNITTAGQVGAIAPQIVTIAFDVTGQLFWSRVNGGFWNGSATADPATGTGGRSVASINAGPYYPIFGANANGAKCVANFGASSFAYPVPSGFVGMDTNVQAYNGSSKFLGQGLYNPPQASANAAKILGAGALTPPLSAVNVAKMLGFVILQTTTSPSADDVQIQLLF